MKRRAAGQRRRGRFSPRLWLTVCLAPLVTRAVLIGEDRSMDEICRAEGELASGLKINPRCRWIDTGVDVVAAQNLT